MYETKTKPNKKVLKTAGYILVGCCALLTMIFAMDKDVPATAPIEAEHCGYYDPSQMPPSVVEAQAPIVEGPVEPLEPEVDPNPYAGLAVTDAEKTLLARMAYSEAGNQSFDGQVAVVQVALNRYMHEAYSGSISDILLAPSQFAVGNYYEPAQMEAVEAALAGEPVLDLNTDVVYFSTGSLTYGSYYKTIGNHVFRTYT